MVQFETGDWVVAMEDYKWDKGAHIRKGQIFEVLDFVMKDNAVAVDPKTVPGAEDFDQDTFHIYAWRLQKLDKRCYNDSQS